MTSKFKKQVLKNMEYRLVKKKEFIDCNYKEMLVESKAKLNLEIKELEENIEKFQRQVADDELQDESGL